MIGKAVSRMTSFIVGSIIGRFMYSSEYFPRGRHFKNWYSIGYTWVVPDFWGRLLFKRNKGVKWPCSPFANVGKNIVFDVDDINNFQSHGSYFQTWDAQIIIGKHSLIGPNVGIITSNHDVYELEKRSGISNVVIGNNCWIGMNSMILPGVNLGDHTIVAAGSVVTHSFSGNCIIAGCPAKIIKTLDINNSSSKKEE